MSSFTTPLIVSPMPDGRRWKLFKEFTYHIGSKCSNNYIHVPAGFVTDFASIPWVLWSWFPYWGKYGKAAVLHDWLYLNRETSSNRVKCKTCNEVFSGGDTNKHKEETGHNVWELLLLRRWTRKEADLIFYEAMLVGGTKPWKAKVMYLAVRTFGWAAWH